MTRNAFAVLVMVGLSLGAVACSGTSGGTGTNGPGFGPGAGTPTGQTAAGVQINGAPADAGELARLEQRYGTKVAAGAYWYDKRSGLAGKIGSYAQAYAPGFDFGDVPRNASNGNTGILFNGRELSAPEADVVGQLFGLSPAEVSQYQGSYVLESSGDLYTDSGQLVGNLVQLAQSRGRSSGGGGGDNFWSSGGASGNSEGGCSYVSIPSSSGSGSTSVSSGCG